MFTLMVLGLVGWFAFRHFANKKREADRRSWSVDFRGSDIGPVKRRLPWKKMR